MFEMVCVTARALCPGDFLSQLERVAAAGVDKVILREKDLPEPAYKALAASALELCRRHEVACVLHNFPQTAKELGARALHLPLPRQCDRWRGPSGGGVHGHGISQGACE